MTSEHAVSHGLNGADTMPATIQPRLPPGSIAPASFAQSRLWYIDQWQPNSPLYNVPVAYRLKGPLDVAVLDRCLSEVARRHEILRTHFVAPEGIPLQVIEPPAPFTSSLLDLSGQPRSASDSALAELIQAEARRPFSLSRTPLWRSLIIRLSPTEYVWVLTMHHIVCDGWSVQVLHRELAALYAAYSRGEPSPLPELAIQYADYSVWHRRQLEGPLLTEQLGYWKARLAGAPPLLELPLDRPRPAEMTSSGAGAYSALPRSLGEAVTAFSRAHRVTPFVTLLAAFAATLYRITGQADLVIGTPVANRTELETEPLIGFFVNTLAMRIDLSGHPTFAELVERVRVTVFDALDHQDLPFERLVEDLQPQRALTHTPVFQVLFQVNEIARVPLSFLDVSVEPLRVNSGIARMDLAVSVQRHADGLQISVTYNSDLFDRATIDFELAAYGALLQGALAHPDQRIELLPLMTQADLQKVVVDWNRTAADYPHTACLHQLFEHQVQRHPGAMAVQTQERSLTYDELNRRANALATRLMESGVAPEVPVAILVDHSAESILAMLAVLKAGGAFVPLDPTAPPERLRFMLSDSRPRLLLTRPSLANLLQGDGPERWFLDLDAPLSDSANACPPSGVTADNLAYIIYTSGSTGTPRGVLVPHRGVVNLVTFDQRTFELGPTARVIHVVAMHFDAATRHISLALGGGGCLYMPDPETILSPPALLSYMRQHSITHAPFILSMMMALPVEDLPALRIVTVGGEAFPAELASRWLKGRRLFNVYGPTEASVMTTWYECLDESRDPPIGRPIANCSAYVLDGNLQPLPPGAIGELSLGGVPVARGYLNHPDLTAERFVPDPFSTTPGARMYRTGDMVRFKPDGNIHFVGRRDFQVKVRGFRIELGDIESALRQHPAVAEAVVITFDAGFRDRLLAAYVVLRQGAVATVPDLLAHLSSRLPPYMVPSFVTILPAMPLTSSGKLDRKALPAPTRSTAVGGSAEPSTEMERLVAAAWCRALKLPSVGVRDNFFDLGGHSLLAMQVIAWIHQQTGVQLSPREMVLGTLGQVAAALERSKPNEPGSAPQPVAPPSGRKPGRSALERLFRRDRTAK